MARLRRNPKAHDLLKNYQNFIINPESYKGLWCKKIFKNDNEIHIEIGSGKGKFIYEIASLNKNINYIAIDKYETVLLKLLKKENIDKISNLKIISIDALEINKYFQEGEISKIYLNFSDPWPKARHEKRRLTSPFFINLYQKVLSNNGIIEFKTDNLDFFNYTIDVLDSLKIKKNFLTFDLHKEIDIENIQTEYEIKFSNKGFKINKVVFNPFIKI